MNLSDRNAGSNRRWARAATFLALVLVAAVFSGITFDPPERPVRTGELAVREADPTSHIPNGGVAHRAINAVDEFATEYDDTTLGIEVLDRKTGELAGNAAAETPLYSASVVKLIVAVDVLENKRATAEDRELLARALGPSDDDAMNELWTRFDGPGAVQRLVHGLGLLDTAPPADPARWGETRLSARDVVSLFDHVLTGMPTVDRDFIMASLAAAPRIASGGFDQGFGLDALDHGRPLVKAGWMCCHDGQITLHSAGVIGGEGRFVVALMSSQPGSQGYDGARDVLTEAAERLDAELR